MFPSHSRPLLFPFAALLFSALFSIEAADWPQWRGPNRTGISTETGLLRQWPEGGPPLQWHAKGIGDAYASVVVADGAVYTIGKRDGDVFASRLAEKDGSLIWQKMIGTTSRNVMSTPTLDGDRLYAVDPDGQLVCLSVTDGEVLWQRDFIEEFGGKLQSGRGYGESPLIDGDRLICTPGGSEAMVVALDKFHGKTIWQAAIPPLGMAGGDGACFSSIVISRGGGVRQYVQMVGRGLIGIAADDGRFLWGYNGISNRTANIPTPSVRDDLVFASNGYNAGSVLLKLTSGGDTGVTAEEIYRLNGSQLQNHHGGTILVGDHVFGGHGSNNGLPTCLELTSGRLKWKRRGPGIGSASIVYADGHIYFHYQNGVIGLVEASTRGYLLKGQFQLPGAGADSWAHPVIANGRLLLREKDQLWVYAIKKDVDANIPPRPAPVAVKPGSALAALVASGVELELLPESTARLVPDGIASSLLSVVLSDEHLTDSGVIHAAILDQLKRIDRPFVLYLGGTHIQPGSLQSLSQVDQVVGLNLEFCRSLNDGNSEVLSKLHSLRLLDLSGTSITDNALEYLIPLRQLTYLNLEVCTDITDQGCITLAKMIQLKGLVLKKTGFEPNTITNEGVAHLAKLTNLELLNLYGNRITDDGIALLEPLRDIRELDLSLLGITDKGLTSLSRLKQLEKLELLYSEGFGGTNLSDPGMKTLAQLSSLRSLNLIGARISDEGFSALEQLKGLKELSIAGTRLSEEAIDRFEAAVPSCRIIR